MKTDFRAQTSVLEMRMVELSGALEKAGALREATQRLRSPKASLNIQKH